MDSFRDLGSPLPAPIEVGLADLLRRRTFARYLAAQFASAFNDNAFKFFLVLLFADSVAAVAAAGALLVLPFLLFSSAAGGVADRFSKGRIIALGAWAEAALMALAAAAIAAGARGPLFALLFLSGVQSAFFSPAKYGYLPETLPPAALSRANALVQATTYLAILAGTAATAAIGTGRPAACALLFLAVTLAGAAAAQGVERPRPARPAAPIRWNPLGGVLRTLRATYPNRVVWHPMWGTTYFWFLGGLVQLLVPVWARVDLGLGEGAVGALWIVLGLGVGAGSLLAGRWSGDKVELGLVPLGSLGVGVALLGLAAGADGLAGAAAGGLLLALAGGLYIVPLQSIVQQKAPEAEKGAVLAAQNFLNFAGVLAASAALSCLDAAGVTPRGMLALFGLASFGVTAYLFWALPQFVVRFVGWLLVHTVYDVRIRGGENRPLRGPALLVAHHVSYVDALLIQATCQRFIRFVMFRGIFDLAPAFFRLMHVIPIGGGPKDNAAAIEAARAALRAGHVVCIFPEGAITRTGTTGRFRTGLERIADGLDVPIVPVHLDGLWGSLFSFRGRWTGRIPFPVTVSFGAPLPPATSARACREAVLVLGAGAMGERPAVRSNLGARFVRTARRRPWRRAVADSLGLDLSFGRLLVAAEVVAGRARAWPEPNVGVALPSGAAGAIANVGLSLAGKTAVNLNVTLGAADLEECARRAGLRRAITTAKVLEKFPLPGGLEAVEIRDVIAPPAAEWVRAAARAVLAPPPRVDPDSPAAILFSSGSTGAPKGVVLTHANILANVEGIAERFDIRARDAVLSGLPLFHSFGLTVATWFPLLNGIAALQAPSPLDARAIGRLAREKGATILLATPTFLAAYLARVAGDLASLRMANVGAEALREDLRRAWKEKVGCPVVQGYGATECAPVVAIDLAEPHGRPGTVGPPIPGVAVRLGEDDVLEVLGPNVMKGYLDDPARTADAVRAGWYRTGDVARIDDDGFIEIVGRLARFAKVAGEMVPLGRLEEAIGPDVAAVAVPDAARGERIVVFHARDLDPAAEVARLRAAGLPNLWVPRAEDFRRVEAIPVLGTGKVDLRRLAEWAGGVKR